MRFLKILLVTLLVLLVLYIALDFERLRCKYWDSQKYEQGTLIVTDECLNIKTPLSKMFNWYIYK